MNDIWQMVGFAVGVVAFVLVFQLLNLPEWISSHLKRRIPREELERKITDLERRLMDVEQILEKQAKF